ncbi:TPA: hypothetical protein SAQ65_002576 [Bacillus cereus]|nr:hypothetical protein [Bacillus cereus]
MKLIDALNELERVDLINISKELMLASDTPFVKSWLVRQIVSRLTDVKQLCAYVFPHLSNEVKVEWIFHCFNSAELSIVSKEELMRFGLVINNDTPSDIKELIQVAGRSYVIKVFSDERIKIVHTPFLKCMLLLSHIIKLGNFECKQSKKDRFVREATQSLFFEDTDRMWIYEFLTYFVRTGILHKTEKMYSVAEDELIVWKKRDIVTTLKRFYKQLNHQFSLSCLQSIGQYQKQPEEWIDMGIIDFKNMGYRLALQYGLIEYIEISGRTFVRLTPEGWCLAKGESHPSWNIQNFIVSAGFELFIPYNYDPFVMLEIAATFQLKDNQFFLVYDLMPLQDKTKIIELKNIQQISYIIMNKSPYIPDVVRYELEQLS